jgi:hypothetical protein
LTACSSAFDAIPVGAIPPNVPASFSVDNGSFDKRAIYLSDALDACLALHALNTSMRSMYDAQHLIVMVLPFAVGSYPVQLDGAPSTARVGTFYADKTKPTGGELAAGRGMVTVTDFVDAKRIAGTVDLYFEDANGAAHVSGRFEALFCVEFLAYGQPTCVGQK